MKKTSLVVTLPVLVLGGLLLSGCGMLRSHKAWETARGPITNWPKPRAAGA